MMSLPEPSSGAGIVTNPGCITGQAIYSLYEYKPKRLGPSLLDINTIEGVPQLFLAHVQLAYIQPRVIYTTGLSVPCL